MQPNARIRNSLLKHVNSWWYHALNMVWLDSMPWAWTTHEQIHHDQSANVSPYQKCFYLHVIALCVGHSELLYISVRNDCHNRTHQQIIIPIKWIWNDFDSFFFCWIKPSGNRNEKWDSMLHCSSSMINLTGEVGGWYQAMMREILQANLLILLKMAIHCHRLKWTQQLLSPSMH